MMIQIPLNTFQHNCHLDPPRQIAAQVHIKTHPTAKIFPGSLKQATFAASAITTAVLCSSFFICYNILLHYNDKISL